MNTIKYNNNHFGDIKISQKDYLFALEYVKDFSARRAAEVTGRDPDSGYKIRDKAEVQAVVEFVIVERAKRLGIDADEILNRYDDLYFIAMRNGNLSVASKAVDGLAKLKAIDAYASSRVDMVVSTDADLIANIRKGRERNCQSVVVIDTSDVTFI